MGNEESAQSNKNNDKSTEFVWNDLFSVQYTNQLFKKITNQENKNIFDTTLDSVFFSSLLENLISSKSKIHQFNIYSELEKSFFLPLIHDFEITHDYSQIFTKCYDEMRSTANSILERENISRKKNNESFLNSFHSLKAQKTATCFLEDFFTNSFNSLLPFIHSLEVSELAKILNNLNEILSDQKNWSLDTYSSSTIVSIQKLIKQICKIQKFQVPEIQILIIKFLFNFANAHGNVNSILSILQITLSFPFDFNTNIDQMNFNLKGPKPKNKSLFTFPFEIDSKIISFSIGSNVLVLAEGIGLIQIVEPEPLIIPVNLCEDSILLDAYHFVYIFSIKLGTIQYFTNNDINIQSIRFLDISKYINIKHKILACGLFNQNITILQNYSKNKYRITVFQNNLEKNPNKVSEIKFTLKSIINNEEEYHPKFYYFNKDEVHFIFDNMTDRPFKIIFNNDKYIVEEMPDLICSSFIADGCPVGSFRNVLYSISQKNGKILFIKNEVSPRTKLKQLPFKFTNVNLPIFNNSNITVAISLIINELTSYIDSQLQYLLENRFIKYISFFISNDKSTFDICFSIIHDVIQSTNIEIDIKMSLISLLIKIISVNLTSYCIKFSKNMKSFNDQDKLLFSQIKDLIELAAFSEPAKYSPLIIEAISILISSNFHYLFYPDYSTFNKFIQKILSNYSLRNHFILNFMLLSTTNCFLYTFSKDSIKIIKDEINDVQGFHEMFYNSLLLINNELQFLTENGIKSNEEYILPYFEFLLSYIDENISAKLTIKLIQNFILRLMLIDDFPLLAIFIVDKSIPIISKYIKICQKDNEFIEDDKKYSDQKIIDDDNEEESIIFESNHNCELKSEVNKEIKFDKSNIIHLTFDPKCHTDPNNSSLNIYDKKSDKKTLLYSFSGNDWIEEIDIASNSILLSFKNESKSDFYWGYKIVCSPKINKKESDFKPCLNLFNFNLFLNTLGRLTFIGLQSIPPTIEEIECKFVLEGDLLEGVTKVFNQKETQIQLQTPESKINNKPLTRGLSNGLSFDATNGAMKYPDDLKKEFINDLILDKNEEEDNLASYLLKFMYKAVKAPHLIRPNPSILLAEKYMIAALMKQLGFINSAISFASRIFSIDAYNNKENESFVIPPNLDKTWKSIYRMRTLLYRSYQKSKEKIVSKQNLKENEKAINDIKLHENFDSFINEIIIKCKFLLFTEPILMKRNYETENYDMETIEKTINELLSFITSELLLENLNRMVEKRTQKIKIRIQALSLMIKMIKSEIKTFKTSKISYLYPLKTSLKLLSDHSDVKSVPNEMIDELNNNLFVIFDLIISIISNPNESDSTRLFYIKMISVNIEDVLQANKIIPLYLNVSKFIQASSIHSIESFITISCLWRILGLWTLEFPTSEIVDALISFSTNSKSDFCQYHSILLLSTISQPTFYNEQLNVSINQIFQCFNKATPRVVVATFMWLSNVLLNSNAEIVDVEINEIKYNMNSFILLLLKAIGSSLCGGSCLFIPDESLHESHMIVADEMITFLRILLYPNSRFVKLITDIFHKILSSSISSVLEKYSHNQNDDEYDDDIFMLIAIFTVLGKEIISIHNSGYSILHTKEMSELVRVTSYEPISGQLKYLMKNNFNEITANEKTSKFVPSSRLPSNPNNFLITENEVKLFISIQNEIVSTLDKLSNVKFSIFSASFIGFLSVCLQNAKNATTFIKNMDLSSFLNCASKTKNLKKSAGIEHLINKINREINLISNANKKFQSTEIKPKKLPYSLVFHFYSPQRFISLNDGKVDQYNIYSYSSKSSLFVGDCSLPNTSIFYFEVKIVSFSSKNIAIGFIDHHSTQETVRINGIGLKNENVYGNKLKSGDVFGFEYSHNTINFFYNGIKLKHSIPSYLIDDFTPAIGTRDCEATFEYNFGHEKFVTDINERMKDEILGDSYENFDVKVQNFKTQLPTTNSFDNDEYEFFIKNGNSVWEKSKPYPNENNKNNEQYFQNNNKNTGTLGEISAIKQINAHFKYYIGESVLISNNPLNKENLNESPFNSLSLAAQFHFNKVGTIVDVKEINSNLNQYLLTIESIDPMSNKKYQFQISSNFVTHFQSKFMKIVENCCRFQIEKDHSLKQREELANSIVPAYLNRHKNNLFNTTRSLIIRMCRFLSLIFVDYFRLKNSLSSYFERYKSTSIDVFSLIISDTFKFIHKPKISPKWGQFCLSDFIFTNENEQETFEVPHFCFCNTYMLSRCIRAIIYQNSKEMDLVLVDLVSNSIDQIAKAKNSSRDGIFNIVSNNFIIESPHPLTSYMIKQSIPISVHSTSFIPILHSKTSIGKNKVKINGHIYRNLHDFDYSIFPQKECNIEFKSNSDSNLFGLLLCIFPIKLHLNEKMAESSLGGIHILFTVLSAIFSKKKKDKSNTCFEKTEKFLKQEVIPQIASLMNKDNYFVDLFAFEIFQPILMNLKWDSEDISSRFEEAFHSFTSGLHQEVTKWEPLHNRAQQGLLISLFTRLLILEISTESNQCRSENEIAYLYDTFIRSKIEPNSSVYDQMTEAVATCIALDSEMPISIKFPAFLIAEKWCENILAEIDVTFEQGKTNIDCLSFDQYKDVFVEFKKEDWLPSNCSILITLNEQEETTNNKPKTNLRRANTLTQFSSESSKAQYEKEFQASNNNDENENDNDKNIEKTFILKPGEKIAVNGRFSAQFIDDNNSTFNTSKQLHLIVTGYPCTHESKRLNFISHFHLFKQHISLFSSNWDVRYDESLSLFIKNNPNIYSDFSITNTDNLFVNEPLLSLLPPPILACRLFLFQRLEHYMPQLIKIVDIGSSESILGDILSSCKSAISTSFKLNLIKNVIERDIRGDSSMVSVRFNRFQASLFHSKPESPIGKPLLDQLISQVPKSSLPKMRRFGGAPWKVDLIGEGATDAGGPGRDLFTESCMELMDPSLGIFIANPNKRVNNINGNQELLIPNPQPMNDQMKNRFLYAGALIGLCYISSIPEPFKFPRFFWDYLTNKPVSIEDIYEVDLQFKQLITSIENCEKTLTDPSQFSDIFSLPFQVQNSLGEMVDLVPGGNCIFVTFQKRLEFVQRCKAYRTKEFNEQLNLIRTGFNAVFPSSAASILTPWEIELLICGDNKCPLDELKKNCSYDQNDPHVKMLWSVLEKFSPEERMLFIKFGCGRMGLPPPGMMWPSKLNIKFKEFDGIPDNLMPLPTAVTCNSKVTIPRYNDIEWMEKKIRTAITMGADIDQDRNARINDLVDVT